MDGDGTETWFDIAAIEICENSLTLMFWKTLHLTSGPGLMGTQKCFTPLWHELQQLLTEGFLFSFKSGELAYAPVPPKD